MEFLYRSATPTYQGCSPQPQQASTSFLAGLWCSLFGSAAPAYRTDDATGAPASAASRCFWQAFPVSPSYKAPPPAPSTEPASSLSPSSDGGCDGKDCETCASDGVPAQIFVW